MRNWKEMAADVALLLAAFFAIVGLSELIYYSIIPITQPQKPTRPAFADTIRIQAKFEDIWGKRIIKIEDYAD